MSEDHELHERVAKLELTQQYHETRLAKTEELTQKTNALLREKIPDITAAVQSANNTKGRVEELGIEVGEVKEQVRTLAKQQNNPVLFTLTKKRAVAIASSTLLALLGSQFLWDLIRQLFFPGLGH